MRPEFVRYARAGGAAQITLNRPDKRNALSREFLAQLAAAVRRARDDRQARLLILRAEGQAFCAGMDLAEMLAARDDATARQEPRSPNTAPAAPSYADAETYRDLLCQILTLPKPTLAVVQGPALAGGAGLVLACDMVLADDHARIGLPEPRRGIVAAVVTPLLVYRIGAGPAGYLLLSGATLDAPAAARLGLFHEVLPAEQIDSRIASFTDDCLAQAPGALAETKRFLLETAGAPLREWLDRGAEVSAAARATQEAREGLRAFAEKRPPRWGTPRS